MADEHDSLTSLDNSDDFVDVEAKWRYGVAPLRDKCVLGCFAAVRRARDARQDVHRDALGPLVGTPIVMWGSNTDETTHSRCAAPEARRGSVAAEFDEREHCDELEFFHVGHVRVNAEEGSQAWQYWQALIATWAAELTVFQVQQALAHIRRYGGNGKDWFDLFSNTRNRPVNVSAIWNADKEWEPLADTLQERANEHYEAVQELLAGIADIPEPDMLVTAVARWRAGERPERIMPGNALRVDNVPSLDDVRRGSSLAVAFQRMCGATLAYNDYATREPGHIFRLFAAVAAQVADEEWGRHLPVVPKPRSWWDIERESNPARRAVLNAWGYLRAAIVTGGMESLTHHALHGRSVYGTVQLFPEAVQGWAAGETFSSFSIGEDARRAAFADPSLKLALQTAVAGVDPVWDAMFDELAAQFPESLIMWNTAVEVGVHAWQLKWAIPLIFPATAIDSTHTVAVVPGVVAAALTSEYHDAVFATDIPSQVTITANLLSELPIRLEVLKPSEGWTNRNVLTDHLTRWIDTVSP
jgi:hypothetical protein